MSTSIRVPRISANEERVHLVRWLVEDGSAVESGQPLVELETSKSAVEVTAPRAGFARHALPAGARPRVGDVMAWIVERVAAAPRRDEVDTEPATGEAFPLRATPAARRLAEATDLDLRLLQRRPVVRERDVLAFLHGERDRNTPRSTSSSSDEDGSERGWEIPDEPPAPPGRALFSRSFFARLLCRRRGRLLSPLSLRLAVASARAFAAIVRGVIAVLARVPLAAAITEMIARAWPRNLVGLALRAAYFRAILADLGVDTMIDPFVEVWGGRNICVGHGCHLDRYASLAADPDARSDRQLIIGPNVHVGPYVQLFGHGGLRIGALTALGAGTKVYSIGNVGDDPLRPARLLSLSHAAPTELQHQVCAAVEIGDYAFVGLNVCVLPGVRIGRGAIIISGTVVASDVPEFAVFGGNPARVLGYRQAGPASVPLSSDEPRPAEAGCNHPPGTS